MIVINHKPSPSREQLPRWTGRSVRCPMGRADVSCETAAPIWMYPINYSEGHPNVSCSGPERANLEKSNCFLGANS